MFVVDTHATGTCDYDTLDRPAFLYTENNYGDVFDVNGKYIYRMYIFFFNIYQRICVKKA